MFTGIIAEKGRVVSRQGLSIIIEAPLSIKDLKIGDSISVNGVCLTAEEIFKNSFKANLLDETIKKTNLGTLKSREPVNIELALMASDRLGGHILTGHVDFTARLIRKYKSGNDTILEIAIPATEVKNIIPKGSIAVNGISLTIVKVFSSKFTTHIIPHTLKNTNITDLKPGSRLNIELDKYLPRNTTAH